MNKQHCFVWFGGTFDPVHYGHLRMAEQLGQALAVEKIHLVPTGTPAHRHPPLASAEHRAAMLALAIANNPRLALDKRELGGSQVNYTIDTLRQMRQQFPNKLLVWLIGADAFLNLRHWKDWQQLFALGHLGVACRAGFDLGSWQQQHELLQEIAPRVQVIGRLPYQPKRGKIAFLETDLLDISASAIRKALASGLSVRYLLPDAVLDYIHQHKLYTL